MKTKDQAWKLRDLIPDFEMYPIVANDYRTNRLAITSGKGGVGKSVIAVNFALLLAQSMYRTLLIDGDINLSKLPILTDTAPRYSYADVKRGEKNLQEVIYEYQPNCSILPTGSGALELIDQREDFKHHFSEQFRRLNGSYDYMIVDSASGISSLVFGEIASCNEVMVVVTPEPTSLADAYAIIKIMSYYYPQIPIHLVLNLVESEAEAVETYRQFDLIVQRFLHRNLNYLGFLCWDDEVGASIKRQRPLALMKGTSVFIEQLERIKEKWLEAESRNRFRIVDRVH